MLYIMWGQHYIEDAACTYVYPKDVASWQYVTNIVGHVDTVWGIPELHSSQHPYFYMNRMLMSPHKYVLF